MNTEHMSHQKDATSFSVIRTFRERILQFYLFIYLKPATEGPEGHLYCGKNTETHKMT